MVIGGIGYCDIQGNFQFHRNILEALQIYNGSLLFGVYHPRSKNAAETEGIKYHFMLSPIPYHVWPRSGRYVIRLKHDKSTDGQTEGIQQISDFLHEEKVAIIYSFSNRSAHRYSTWDIHVCFDKFSNEDLENDYDETRSCYNKTYDEAHGLAEKIKAKFPDLLFSDEADIDLVNCITSRVNTSCHYFYYESENLQKQFPGKRIAYEPFTLRYNNGNFKTTKGGVINEVIHTLEPEKMDFQLPSICFAEADSHYLNLRLIIIPSELKHQFFKISVFHERLSSSPDMNNTSKGLLHYISRAFPKKDYKIWKSSTSIFEHREKGVNSYCNGKLNLFIEARNLFNEDQADVHKANLETLLRSLDRKENKPADLDHVRLVSRCEKIFPDLIDRYFRVNRRSLKKKMYDVFISYSHEDKDQAKLLYEMLVDEGCNVFMDKERNEAGEILSQKIEDGLNNSRELCLLLSKRSLKSSWVTTEWGAAWILKKHTIPILIDLTYKDLPKIDKRISEKICVKWPADYRTLKDTFVRQVIKRRFESMLYDEDYNY